MKRGMFRASGSTATGVVAFAGPEAGQIVCDSLSYTGDAAGVLKFYRAKQRITAAAACTGSATLSINTDAAGKVGGAVVTTSDYVIIESSTSAGTQLRSVGTVGAVSSGKVALTLGAVATCASGDVVYLVRAADIHSITVAAESKTNLLHLFNSYKRFPVAIEITGSTGAKLVSGTYTVENE